MNAFVIFQARWLGMFCFLGILFSSDIQAKKSHPKLARVEQALARDFVKDLQHKSGAALRIAARQMAELGPAAAVTVPTLIKLLKEPSKRRAACLVLRAIGRKASPATPTLRKHLFAKNPHASHAMVGALTKMGPRGLKVLIRALRHKNRSVRRVVIRGIEELGPKAKKAIPALLSMLRGRDCYGAASTLAKIGAKTLRGLLRALRKRKYNRGCVSVALSRQLPLPPWTTGALLRALRKSVYRRRYRHGERHLFYAVASAGSTSSKVVKTLIRTFSREAGEYAPVAFRNIRSKKRFIAFLGKALRHRNHVVRYRAAQALGRLKPRLPEAVTVLTKALRDKNKFVRLFAAASLRQYGRLASKADKALLQLLQKKNRGLRSEDKGFRHTIEILQTLAVIQPRRGAVKKILVPFLNHQDSRVRFHAAYAVGGFSSKATPALSSLVKMTKSANVGEARAALFGLGAMGTAAEKAIPLLLRGMRKERRSRVLTTTGIVLGRLGPKGIDALIAGIRSRHPNSMLYSAIGLSYNGTKATKAVPALITLLSKRYTIYRSEASKALWKIGPNAYPAIPALIRNLKPKNRYLREFVARALVSIGARSVPALIRTLDSRYPWTRGSAVYALGMLKKSARPAVTKLTSLLKNEKKKVRLKAAQALEKIGFQKARVSSSLFRIAQKDPSLQIRLAAVKALRKWYPTAK